MCHQRRGDQISNMTTFFCVALFGIFLSTANTQNWDLNKMRQCSCTSNATMEIPSAVARGCITDAKGRRVTLRLSPSSSEGCIAEVKDQTYPGEVNIFMTYNGRLLDGTMQSQEMAADDTAHQSDPEDEMEFTLQVNVEKGKIYDPNVAPKTSSSGTKVRKRDLMPFSFMNFNIIITMDQEAGCDVKDQTKALLIRGIKRYWLKMTNCLFDVI